MDQQKVERAPLDKRLDALALMFQERAWADPTAANSGYLQDHAQSLAEFANQLREEYARLSDGDVVTNAQAIALGRRITERTLYLRVTRGGDGLDPEQYLLVYAYDRVSDTPFVCGIDRGGRVSS